MMRFAQRGERSRIALRARLSAWQVNRTSPSIAVLSLEAQMHQISRWSGRRDGLVHRTRNAGIVLPCGVIPCNGPAARFGQGLL